MKNKLGYFVLLLISGLLLGCNTAAETNIEPKGKVIFSRGLALFEYDFATQKKKNRHLNQ